MDRSFCMISLSACGEGQKAQEIYDSIGDISFSDDSILTNDELSQLEQMRAQKEQYLEDKDVDGLTSLKDEWTSFRQPIDSYITQYQSICDTFFGETEKELMTDEEREACKEMETNIAEAYKGRDSETLSKMTAEWNNYSNNLREVIDTYEEINQAPFDEDTDKTLLSSDTLDKMEDLSERTEAAFADRDAETLKSLESEWSSVTSSAQNEIEDAKKKMLNDWVNGANVTNSLTNLFSLGQITSSTDINGHTITYTTQYNYEVEESEIEQALDSYLSWAAPVFESGVSTLKPYLDDVCIRVEYLNENGNVISYKEFK